MGAPGTRMDKCTSVFYCGMGRIFQITHPWGPFTVDEQMYSDIQTFQFNCPQISFMCLVMSFLKSKYGFSHVCCIQIYEHIFLEIF